MYGMHICNTTPTGLFLHKNWKKNYIYCILIHQIAQHEDAGLCRLESQPICSLQQLWAGLSHSPSQAVFETQSTPAEDIKECRAR